MNISNSFLSKRILISQRLLNQFIFVQNYRASYNGLGTNVHARFYSRVQPEKLSYLSVPGKDPLLGITFGELVDNSAVKFGDSLALISHYQNERRTFKQLKEEIDSLAEGFLRIGFQQGDRIGIWGPNSLEWVLTKMAAIKAGLILVNINPVYQGTELIYCLNKVGIKGVVMDEQFRSQNYYDIICSVVPEIPNSEPGKIKSQSAPNLSHLIIPSSKPYKGTFQFGDVVETGRKRKQDSLVESLASSIQFDDVCNIQFTSGTTGKPKGVKLSHHNLINNSYLTGKRFSYSQKDKVCLSVPLFHCYGGVLGLLNCFHFGMTCVLPSAGFNAVESLEAIEKERCTVLYGTPTMHVDMLNKIEQKKYDLSSLRLTTTAGSFCPVELIKKIKAKYTVKEVGSFYGLTETSPAFYQSLPEDDDELRSKTIGYPLEGVEVKLVDKEGKIVKVGETGEMCTRGHITMLGYWDDKEKTREVLTESGWFHTGDLFVFLESGHASIVGRLKDMIIRGGENVYPKEIEDFLHTCPLISEAHVFGVPDERLGEEIAAWICLKEGEKMTKEDFKIFCKGKIAHYKVPRHIEFTTSFPTTVSGKIQKFKMRDETIKKLNLKK